MNEKQNENQLESVSYSMEIWQLKEHHTIRLVNVHNKKKRQMNLSLIEKGTVTIPVKEVQWR